MDYYRTRFRVKDPGRGYIIYEFLNKQGDVIRSSTEPQTYLGRYEEINDWNHPGFGPRSEAGEIIISPLSMSVSETFPDEGLFEFPEGDSGHRYSGDMFSAFNRTNPPDLSADRNSLIHSCTERAAISALKKLNTAQVDMGENLGTLAQTIGMFQRPFNSAAKLFTKMEKRRLKRMSGKRRVETYAKATADTWLEGSFGIRPILKDIGTISSAIGDQVELIQTAVKVARGKGEGSVKGSNSSSYVHGGENPMTGTIAEGQRETTTKVKVGCGVYYKTPLGDMSQFLARQLGLGVHNLPVSGWNLLPHSWFVDQFWQVGDWIQAMNPDPDLVILGKWKTIVIESTTSSTCTLKVRRSKGTDSPTWFSGNCGSHREVVTSVNRELNFDLPSHPQFNPFLGKIAIAANNAAYGFQMINRMLSRWR